MRKRNVLSKTVLILISLMVLLVLAGCAEKIDTTPLADALGARDADAVISEVLTLYEKEAQELYDPILQESFQTMAASENYDDFVFMDTVLEGITETDSVDTLNAIVKDAYKNRVKAFLSGQWVRMDGTSLDGIVLDITLSDDVGIGTISSIASILDADTTYAENDVKWKNIQVVDANRITYEDLTKGDGSYYSAVGTIDYLNNTINVHNSSPNPAPLASYGVDQLWVKKEYVDSMGDLRFLTEDDFTFTDDQTGETVDAVKDMEAHGTSYDAPGFCFYFFDPNVDPVDDNGAPITITTIRGISIGSSKEDVIKAYGLGSHLNITKDSDDYLAWTLQGAKDGEQDCKYIVDTTGLNATSVMSYTAKENRSGHSIRFYFDSNDKVMCIYYVYARIEPHIFINSDGSLYWD